MSGKEMEDFVHELTTSNGPDDILAQWHRMDSRLKQGRIATRHEGQMMSAEARNTTENAHILARCLHGRLLINCPLQDRTNKSNPQHLSSYHTKLDETKTLHVMVLCNLIHTTMRGRSDVSTFGSHFCRDVAASIPRVARLMLLVNTALSPGPTDELQLSNSSESTDGSPRMDATLRCLTMSNCIQMMVQLLQSLEIEQDDPSILSAFVDALLDVLNSNTHTPQNFMIPSDILVEAGCALARIVEMQADGAQNRSCWQPPTAYESGIAKRIEDSSDVLLTVLGAAASTDSLRRQGLVALGQLVRGSNGKSIFGSTIVQRPPLIRTIRQCLMNDNSMVNRTHALELVYLLRPSFEALRNASTKSAVSNLSVAMQALTKAALKESDAKLQLDMVNVLYDFLQIESLAVGQFSDGLRTLHALATADKSETSRSTRSALVYLKSAKHHIIHHGIHVETLVDVVRFVASDIAKVRLEALEVLKHLTFWKPDCVGSLLQSTDALDRFSDALVSVESKTECCLVAEICQQIVFVNCDAFCSSATVLGALAKLATTEPITNRHAYTIAVGVVLELLSSGDKFVHFLPFSNLVLPWLVKLANRTSDDKMKSRLVAAIVGLTTAILE